MAAMDLGRLGERPGPSTRGADSQTRWSSAHIGQKSGGCATSTPIAHGRGRLIDPPVLGATGRVIRRLSGAEPGARTRPRRLPRGSRLDRLWQLGERSGGCVRGRLIESMVLGRLRTHSRLRLESTHRSRWFLAQPAQPSDGRVGRWLNCSMVLAHTASLPCRSGRRFRVLWWPVGQKTTTDLSTSPSCILVKAASTWSSAIFSVTKASRSRRPCW